MFILRHSNTTTEHGAPSNWNPETDGPCETLPTISVNLDGRVVHASFWQPEPHELEQLNRGGAIELHILQPVHPVVSLRVNAWPGERRDETGALIELGPDGKEWAKTEAGYKHVESVVHKSHDGSSPIGGRVWHGHAVREAFVAGAEWQEARGLHRVDNTPSPSTHSRVKPLEWRKFQPKHRIQDETIADTPFGRYSIVFIGEWQLYWNRSKKPTSRHGSAVAAMEAAQADHDKRVLALISAHSLAPEKRVAGWTKVPDELPQEFLRSINRDNQVLAYENGRYYNAWFEFEPSEGGWLWTDEADSEPNPSHYRMLSEVALATTEGSNDGQ